MGQGLLIGIKRHLTAIRLGRRCVIASACLVSSALVFQHLPARAAEFVSAGGGQVSGEIIRLTKSTVTISPTGGSMILIGTDDIELVRYTLDDGSVIEGTLHDWYDGTYVLEVAEELISAEDGTVVATASPGQPEGQPGEEIDAAESIELETTPSSPERPLALQAAGWRNQPGDNDVTDAGANLSAADGADQDGRLEIKATAGVMSEEAEELIVDISSSRPWTDDIIIFFTTLNGTAEAGSDFENTNGIVRLPAGETQIQLAIPLIDDDEAEDDEQLTLYLSSAIDVATIPERKIAATILDND